MSIKWSLRTDVGMVRKANEDSILFEENKIGHKLFVVADGMGGHNAGDVASQMACEIIGNKFREIDKKTNYQKFITNVMAEANATIYNHALVNEECHNMGTTVSLVVHTGKEIFIGNVGDSRVYYMDKERIIQLTKDDTLVQLMVDQQTLSEEDAKNSKYKNVLIQAIGSSSKVMIKTKKVKLPKNYRLLLCSDGLTGYLEDKDLLEIIYQNKDLEEANVALINEANTRDGSDNCSVILIEGAE